MFVCTKSYFNPTLLKTVLQFRNVMLTCGKSYSSKPLPSTCPGLDFSKDGKDIELKPVSEYPDWLWTLGGPKIDFKDMSLETHGKAYEKRRRKMHIREQNMILKSRKF